MRRIALVLVAAALATAPNRAATTSATLAVPSRANANVSMAAQGQFVAVTWSASTEAGTTDVFAATSKDGGQTFLSPVRVNSVAGDARVNGEQPPRVSLRPRQGGAPEVAVLWTTKGAQGTKLLAGISTDGGETFAPSGLVPGTDGVGNRGWEGLGTGPAGRFFAVWLDHRKLAQQDAQVAGQHQHMPGMTMPATPAKADDVAMAQLSQLYVSPLDGASPPVAVTGGVCYCCKTAILSGGANNVYVAWRHVYPGSMRDIAFSASRDGGKTFSAPVRVSEDKWQIQGCPDDGPSMAVDARGRIHIVWPSVVSEKDGPVKALFHAMSADGKTFTSRTRLPTQGQANHPQLSIRADGGMAVVWDESGTGTRRLASAFGTVDASGAAKFVRSAGLAEIGTYPVLAPIGSDWLAAWTTGEPGKSVIKTARIQN